MVVAYADDSGSAAVRRACDICPKQRGRSIYLCFRLFLIRAWLRTTRKPWGFASPNRVLAE
jgi:hypothetical protein